MKSRASFFNRHFSRVLLRRFWPLLLLWLAAMVLAGPVYVARIPPERFETAVQYVNHVNREILDSGRAAVYLGFAAAPLLAMAMLSYLYNPRVCGLVGSLPMRRETAGSSSAVTIWILHFPSIRASTALCRMKLYFFSMIPRANSSPGYRTVSVPFSKAAGFKGSSQRL